MQRRIREDRIELLAEGQVHRIHDTGVEATSPRCRDHLLARIHTYYDCSRAHQPLCQRAIAAAEIENALASTRLQQRHDRRAQLGDEAGGALVFLGIPALTGQLAYSVACPCLPVARKMISPT